MQSCSVWCLSASVAMYFSLEGSKTAKLQWKLNKIQTKKICCAENAWHVRLGWVKQNAYATGICLSTISATTAVHLQLILAGKVAYFSVNLAIMIIWLENGNQRQNALVVLFVLSNSTNILWL